MADDTVPFGKYRGRPVEDMLADAEYVEWLSTQGWFRAKFSHLLSRRDAEAASRTPVHNRLQALFLDRSYCLAFARIAAPRVFNAAEAAFCADRAGIEAEAQTSLDMLRQSALALRKEAENDLARAAPAQSAPPQVLSWMSDIPDDDAYSMASLHRRSATRNMERAAEKDKEADAIPGFVAGVMAGSLIWSVSPKFEWEGADVYIELAHEWTSLARLKEPPRVRPETVSRGGLAFLRVEIKPAVSDDYPAVIRQMGRNKSQILFVERYEGEGATEAQFVAMFAASGLTVVFKRDVDAEAARLRETGA